MNPIYAVNGMQALERVFGQQLCHAVIGEADWPLALNNYPGKPALYNHLAVQNEDAAGDMQETDLFSILAKASSTEEKNVRLSWISSLRSSPRPFMRRRKHLFLMSRSVRLEWTPL
ncbi:hypothetical protein ACFTAO_15340 [Paenibacillus rhizoplanae]